MIAIFKKELWSYFGNWSAWLIIAAFSLIGSLFLFFFENDSNIFDIGTSSLQSYFVLAPWFLMFIIPAVSMKSLAEEEQSGTLNWLFSQPVKISEIIGGKFLSVWLVGILCIIPSLVYLYTIYILGVPEGNIDLGATFGSYFGLILLIAAFSSVGILASALSQNQIMAYLLGVFLCFIFYFGIEQLASYKLLGGADYILGNLGFYQHFIAFTRGLIDTKDVFYFLLVIGICLFLAKIFVEKKK
ncbi:ABC transporter permease subunit [Kaistella jeonii]|uniref:Gliding motility protein Gldf n=1 Tax=Kaistella jeonii TaxID=266749 RepID=A0A0C1D3B2_9FLAO|nr:ABC transporter permease subunit [Kaistella jeonii]KIA88300.1 gliding motility protein Gldf [Kaistella jeonii]SFC24332.1 ABC-2 type transport system permease protein [Kaistella jeonii]VEI94605.1 ABC-type transport system involved in multi-copper enzyme maturation, permease component [Kaistella jeonii]